MKKEIFERLQNMTHDIYDDERCPYCKMSAKLLTEFVEEICEELEQSHKKELREAIEEAINGHVTLTAWEIEAFKKRLFKKFNCEE